MSRNKAVAFAVAALAIPVALPTAIAPARPAAHKVHGTPKPGKRSRPRAALRTRYRGRTAAASEGEVVRSGAALEDQVGRTAEQEPVAGDQDNLQEGSGPEVQEGAQEETGGPDGPEAPEPAAG